MNEVLTRADIAALLGRRRRDCNKGDNGKGLLLAGSEGFYGAAVMAAASCLRAGVGTLKVLCPGGALEAFYALPEAMVYPVGPNWAAADMAQIRERLAEADCLAIGPGLGREGCLPQIVRLALSTGKPAVVDADGLNALSRFDDDEKAALLHENTILTPHPGEMARLTGLSIDEVKADVASIAAQYARRWGCTVLLKGARTAISGPDGRLKWNETGNAGLAKGGSGDVLTGIILALLGQKLPPYGAACAGSYLLGASAEEALSLLQERVLMARDVIDALEQTLAMLRKN
ncbi:MAG: NAD(P)H-hydrate dehydratase [Candidatus Pelethousia sp.]|nr:NAD(P)H-hydrate dehydratase [Candidatus Pelethousia sp.]